MDIMHYYFGIEMIELVVIAVIIKMIISSYLSCRNVVVDLDAAMKTNDQIHPGKQQTKGPPSGRARWQRPVFSA